MKYIKNIFIAIVLIILSQSFIYALFAFLIWDINWIPNDGWFIRLIYAVLALPSILGAIGFVLNDMDS